MRRILVVGIGTDVGKTLVSAILVKALHAHYWKPVQSGNLEATDAQKVKALVPEAICHPETYRFSHPSSPHQAAAFQGIEIMESAFRLPTPEATLVIEAAGGIFVPYRSDRLLIDLYLQWYCEWILVSRHYLGSINHTLLSIEALKRRGVNIRGIIFNGIPNRQTEKAIMSCGNVPLLGRLYPETEWTSERLQHYGAAWKL